MDFGKPSRNSSIKYIYMYMYVIGVKLNYSSCNLYLYPLRFMGEPFIFVSKISEKENSRKVPSFPS